MNDGLRPPVTATLVSGTLQEKARTPSAPQARPAALPLGFALGLVLRPTLALALAVAVAVAVVETGAVALSRSGMAFLTIALLCSLMEQDSSVGLVAARLRTAARSLPAGSRLPSTREICAAEQVSPVTVQRAVRLLVTEGLVEARPGVGNFVLPALGRTGAARGDFAWQTTALGEAWPLSGGTWGSGVRPVADGTIGMHSTYPAEELLPAGLVRAALSRAIRTPLLWQAAPGPGLQSLRAWFATELSHAFPGAVHVGPDDVVVVSGGQAGIAATLTAVTRPGDKIVMESPTYWGGIAAARAHGLDIVPIARTADGIDPGDLERALAGSGARIVYAQPQFANPTGQSWSGGTRRAVLRILAEHKAFLIEDDWARDFALDGDAPPPLAASDADGHVIYVRSLTKSLGPAIRVTAVIARGAVRARIESSRMTHELYTSGILQQAAFDVLRDPAWSRHTRTLRTHLRDRRTRLAAALHDAELHDFTVPPGGLSLWLRIPDAADAVTVGAHCLRSGLALSTGPEWFPAEPTAQYVRLSYANADPARFPEAAQILSTQLPPR
jgi:DNA-binding transcriptional MocR family regulator